MGYKASNRYSYNERGIEMGKAHNSSALAKQVADKLNLSQGDGMKLYAELSQIPEGIIKDVLEKFAAPKESTKVKYVAYIDSEYADGGRYATSKDKTEWTDAKKMPLFIGIVEAETEISAKQMAAVCAGVNKDVVTLISV